MRLCSLPWVAETTWTCLLPFMGVHWTLWSRKKRWSRRGEAMGRRYDVWRCEFEKCLAMQHKWCELLEAEVREERESECSKEAVRPPAPQTSAAYEGSFVTSLEKVATRTQPAAEDDSRRRRRGCGEAGRRANSGKKTQRSNVGDRDDT